MQVKLHKNARATPEHEGDYSSQLSERTLYKKYGLESYHHQKEEKSPVNWAYLEMLDDKKAKTVKSFLKRVYPCPAIISSVLTDNGEEFTNRFIANGERQTTGKHPFGQGCSQYHIEHRLIKLGRPQTNGMVERFNGRIGEVLATHHFNSTESLELTLQRYSMIYNHAIPQKALHCKPPVEAMKMWHRSHAHLFRKQVCELARLDT